MRYLIYIYLYNMLISLQEAAEHIQSGKDVGTCRQLLTDCAQVLETVERTLRNNEDTIRDRKIFDLLALCKGQGADLLNTVGNATPNQKNASEFTESVIALRKQYRDGINVIYRVVFFAELGQKWDSMSSVYNAFRLRKDCDTIVVLAPIYRAVNSNGIVKTDVTYEDYLTPMGIQNVPFNQYDISKDPPDLAFTCNPYESDTLPQFWPENIAKYTRLVYLPYFTERVIDKESIQAHCCLPVAQYAWRIVAQSQNMKNMHRKYAPKHGENVLVTGLPKWDNIFEISEKPANLSAEWEKKLKGKKVFLWNSHYDIHSDTATLFDYGKMIVELFSKRNDIALIWRPHPLTETIFKLYYPHNQPFWEELKETVEKSNNMVIDKNLSYSLAFQCSDALITDFSSIMAQYMLVEKPILWLRKAKEAKRKKTTEYLVHIDCLEQATSPMKISGFIDHIVRGIDSTKKQRLKVMQDDMPSADGHIGERVCELLLKELQKDDGVKA